MESFFLRNKNALITGASSGVGKATAELFSQLGANVLITGRNEKNLKSTAEICELNKVDKNQRVILFIANLSEEEEVTKLADKALSEFTQLDILVNNAGFLLSDSIETMDISKFDSVINVNLRSVIQLTHLLSKSIIKAKGTIINVSSVAGPHSFSGIMSYCISKAGLDQFTKCAALELAPKGVRVNAVNPGVIVTNVHRRSGMKEDDYLKFLERSKLTHAMGRPGDPLEVAYSIAFLASQAASFTTGISFPIDGGRHIMCPR